MRSRELPGTTLAVRFPENKSINSTNIHIAQSLHEMKIAAEPGSFHDFSSLSVKILVFQSDPSIQRSVRSISTL